MAAGIKYILQKEICDTADERIISVVHVSKLFKKKNTYYLCILTTIKPRVLVSICQIKHEKGIYKKKRSWELSELKQVDGRNETADTHEFDLILEKQYRWLAPNLHERQHFITTLWKQANKLRSNKIDFKNVPQAWFSLSPEHAVTTEKLETEPQSDESDELEYEDFNALTEKEENDLNKLMKDCNYAISNAELFMEQLSSNLQDLDGANVQSVLASEAQVNKLMEQIETAIEEAEKIENRLTSYDEILCHIRDTMEKMGEKNAMIEIANNNNIKLQDELKMVVTQLDLPHNYQSALANPDLTTSNGLKLAIEAGKALQNAMNSEIDPPLLRLTAVQDQRKRFDKWKAKFSQAITRHLNNLFIHLGNDFAETQPSSDLVLPKHNNVHRELAAYSELMHWMKNMDRKAYDALVKVYTSSLSKVYERDIRVFFEQACKRTQNKRFDSRDELNTSVSGKLFQSGGKTVQHPYGLLGVNKELWSLGAETSERHAFDSVLEKVLAELEPVALSEQMFCMDFFQLNVSSPTSKSNVLTPVDPSTPMLESPGRSDRDLSFPSPQKKLDRQINEELRKMMSELFAVLETELINYIMSFEKYDSFFSFYVLVRLTQHVMSAQDAHSFLSMTFGSALIHVKRSFDKFMHLQLQSIKDAKVPKRSKCGLLPYVENFEEFARTSESIFKKTQRRTDLDKWYTSLVKAIFENIPIHAQEHPKTPHQVINMENFHHMHSLLKQLKVPVLEEMQKEAKVRYQEALRAYVTKYFGKPLEKLNLFFEGVQQKVSQGVKETEISYQMAYSKQELRKVIAQYPAKEVKKGLESLYKKVDKHLCEEENLLQVVWRAMQEEFITQYNYLEERIQRCYAGAMITLDFTINDILGFFTEIAQSH
uniref:CSON004723 protein n=1 Tax=Culicoides sonorensis TaxID=179676 RepID=A0A336LUA5_CULSO